MKMECSCYLNSSWTSIFQNKNEYFNIGYNNLFLGNEVHDFSSLTQKFLPKNSHNYDFSSQLIEINYNSKKENEKFVDINCNFPEVIKHHQIASVESIQDDKNKKSTLLLINPVYHNKVKYVQHETNQIIEVNEKNLDLKTKLFYKDEDINLENNFGDDHLLNSKNAIPDISLNLTSNYHTSDLKEYDHFPNIKIEDNVQNEISNESILNSDNGQSISKSMKSKQFVLKLDISDNSNDVVELHSIIDNKLESSSQELYQVPSFNNKLKNNIDDEYSELTKKSEDFQLSKENLINQNAKDIEKKSDKYEEHNEEPEILVSKILLVENQNEIFDYKENKTEFTIAKYLNWKSDQLNIDLFNCQPISNLSDQPINDQSDQEVIHIDNYYITKHDSLTVVNLESEYDQLGHSQLINMELSNVDTDNDKSTKNLELMVQSQVGMLTNQNSERIRQNNCKNDDKNEFINTNLGNFESQIFTPFLKSHIENNSERNTSIYDSTRVIPESQPMEDTKLKFELDLLDKLQLIDNLYNRDSRLTTEPIKFPAYDFQLYNKIMKPNMKISKDKEYKIYVDEKDVKSVMLPSNGTETEFLFGDNFNDNIQDLSKSFTYKCNNVDSSFNNELDTAHNLNLNSDQRTTGIHRCHLFPNEVVERSFGKRKRMTMKEKLKNSALDNDKLESKFCPFHFNSSFKTSFCCDYHLFNKSSARNCLQRNLKDLNCKTGNTSHYTENIRDNYDQQGNITKSCIPKDTYGIKCHTYTCEMDFQKPPEKFDVQRDSSFCRICLKDHFPKSKDITRKYPNSYKNFTSSYQKYDSLFQSAPNIRNMKNILEHTNSQRSFRSLINGNKEMCFASRFNLDKYGNERRKRMKQYDTLPLSSNTMNTSNLNMRVYCRGKLIFDPIMH